MPRVDLLGGSLQSIFLRTEFVSKKQVTSKVHSGVSIFVKVLQTVRKDPLKLPVFTRRCLFILWKFPTTRLHHKRKGVLFAEKAKNTT